ncbi:MAG: hypothetical protein K8W52_16995 [Deltaproteobacteria bacterium]|nr:hypothetical protein [Deltaproteobacteria bacterium]
MHRLAATGLFAVAACHGKPPTAPAPTAPAPAVVAPTAASLWTQLSSSPIPLPAGTGDYSCDGKGTLGAMALEQFALFNADGKGVIDATCAPLAGGRWKCRTVIHYAPRPGNPCSGNATSQFAYELDAAGQIVPITLECMGTG